MLLKDVAEAAEKTGHIDLFCDYDGVLVPIAPRPQDACLDEKTIGLLRRLSHHHALHTSIVSGRSLADIRMRVGVPGITYVGNHGLEIEGPGIERAEHIPHHALEIMRVLAETLQSAMQQYPGVIVEDKTLVVAVHFRLADPGQVPLILRTFSALVADRNAGHLLRVTSGMSLVEVRPNVACDKGTAVKFLLEKRHGADFQTHTLPVYLGDDETDEDAFRALQSHGMTIRVGHPPPAGTAAHSMLRDTNEVHVFLDRLLHIFP